MAVTLLLIQNIWKIIQFAQIYINFITLAQYNLNDKKALYFIEYVLYKLEKTK